MFSNFTNISFLQFWEYVTIKNFFSSMATNAYRVTNSLRKNVDQLAWMRLTVLSVFSLLPNGE